MARLDPDRYPDRLAFDAQARRLRREETDRAFHAAVAWLRREGDLAQGWLHAHVAAPVASAQRHSPR